MSRRVVRSLAELVAEFKARNTFGGYDWGDPVQLWWARKRRTQFTEEQWVVACRTFDSFEEREVSRG